MKKWLAFGMGLLLLVLMLTGASAVTYREWGSIVDKSDGSEAQFDHGFRLTYSLIDKPLTNSPCTSLSIPEEGGVTCTEPGTVIAISRRKHTYVTVQGSWSELCERRYTLDVQPLNHGDSLSELYPATCTSNAIEGGLCKYCNENVLREVPDTRLEHDFQSYQPYKPATCTTPADEISYCSYGCGATHIRSAAELNPDVHLWSDWVPNGNGTHTRTCTENAQHQETGNCETPTYCSICRQGYFPGGFVVSYGTILFYEGSDAEITIPDAVTTIPDKIFIDTAITQVVIPDSVTLMGPSPFPADAVIISSCTAYAHSWADRYGYEWRHDQSTAVTDDAIPATHVTTGLTEGSHCSVCLEPITAQQVVPMVVVQTVTLPASLETLGTKAFLGTNAVCVIVPDGCEALDASVFADCRALRFVEIPASVKQIDDHAFDGCSSDMIIVTVSGSRAEAFAQEQGLICIIP